MLRLCFAAGLSKHHFHRFGMSVALIESSACRQLVKLNVLVLLVLPSQQLCLRVQAQLSETSAELHSIREELDTTSAERSDLSDELAQVRLVLLQHVGHEATKDKFSRTAGAVLA